MPKAIIDLSERANRIINIVKAKEGLRGKSEAIERIVHQYEEYILEPHLRPDFVADVHRVRKGKFQPVGQLDDLLK